MNKNYNIYYSSRVITGIGDALQEIAIITIIASLTKSAAISGIVVALNAMVRIICSLFVIKNKFRKNPQQILVNLNYLYAFITMCFYIMLLLNSYELILTIFVILYETICSLIYTFYKIYQDMIVKEVTDSNEKIARLFATDNIIKISTSLITILLLTFMSYKSFLVINTVSFLISGYLITKLNINLSLEKSKINTNNKNQLLKNVSLFCEQYIIVFKLVILSAILSFFFASYPVLLQETIDMFNIDVRYIGILNSIYYVLSIFLSYVAGYVNIINIKKISLRVLGIGLLFSLLGLSNVRWIIIAFILILYPIVGSGYNTVVQIYFQNNTDRNDIPILKGIYNIICGISILISGILSPILVQNITVFFVAMSILFIISIIYIFSSRNI